MSQATEVALAWEVEGYWIWKEESQSGKVDMAMCGSNYEGWVILGVEARLRMIRTWRFPFIHTRKQVIRLCMEKSNHEFVKREEIHST